MYSLLQSTRARGAAGEPLPTVFPSLQAAGIEFVRGELILLAAGPGAGKSLFTLTLAILANVPTLYFSADSNAFSQLSRAISIILKIPYAQATAMVLEETFDEKLSKKLKGSPVRFVYSGSPSVDEIESNMQTFDEFTGDYPHLVVMDNVTNVVSEMQEMGKSFSGLEGLMDWSNDMARKTDASVLGLHHVTGPYVNGVDAPPLNGVKEQITRVPSRVYTLFTRQRDEFSEDKIYIANVKNRGGEADAEGNLFATLDFDGPHMRISDPKWGPNGYRR